MRVVAAANVTATVTLSNLRLTNSVASPFRLGSAAHVTLRLRGVNKLTSCATNCAGLQASSDTILSISDIVDDNNPLITLYSELTATGGNNAAGIGGGADGAGGTVTISGGTVTATGGDGSAGIGGGYSGAGGTVTIEGGTVTATGGYGGAGIGGGGYGDGGTVTISGGTVTIEGGTVTATGGYGGAGIGGGYVGEGGTVTISGGTVTATGNNGGHDIGMGGAGSTSGTNIFTGGSVYLHHGTITNWPIHAAAASVYCVTVGGLPANESVALSGLPADYGTTDIFADAAGKAYLWLPNGDYSFTAGGLPYAATVDNADTTATNRDHTRPSSPNLPPVPFAWIDANFSGYVTDGNYDAAVTNPLSSGYTIEEAYLIGLTNETDELKITSIDPSTEPPTLTFAPSNALPQVKYTQKGVTNLTGEAWTSPVTTDHRFFRLEVKWEE